MNLSIVNVLSLLALALSGAGLVVSARRIMKVIREVEKRLSRAVDEKNLVAASLRRARFEHDAMRNDIQQADTHITQLSGDLVVKESQLGRVRVQPRRVINMVDREWQRFARIWSMEVINPSLRGTMVPGAGAWEDGRTLYGFARSPEDLHQRVLAHYPANEGFVAGNAVEVDLTEYVETDGTAPDADGRI